MPRRGCFQLLRTMHSPLNVSGPFNFSANNTATLSHCSPHVLGTGAAKWPWAFWECHDTLRPRKFIMRSDGTRCGSQLTTVHTVAISQAAQFTFEHIAVFALEGRVLCVFGASLKLRALLHHRHACPPQENAPTSRSAGRCWPPGRLEPKNIATAPKRPRGAKGLQR